MSSWVLPLIIVSVVILLCASATGAMIYVHRERIKTSLNHHGHEPNPHQQGGSTRHHTCKLHLPSALITLTSQSPRFRIKLARSSANASRSQTCEKLDRDFQAVASPVSSSSTRFSHRNGSSDNLCKTKQWVSLQDEGEAAFLEIGPKARSDSIWIERKAKGHRSSLNQEPRKKRKHFLYATLRKIRLCNESEGKRQHRFQPGLIVRQKKSLRGESEEESDYAYIDRSTHSITGYLNSEAKNGQIRKAIKDPGHPLSTFCQAMPMIEHQVDNDDPLSPYATTQVILTHQQMMDPHNQQVWQILLLLHDTSFRRYLTLTLLRYKLRQSFG